METWKPARHDLYTPTVAHANAHVDEPDREDVGCHPVLHFADGARGFFGMGSQSTKNKSKPGGLDATQTALINNYYHSL